MCHFPFCSGHIYAAKFIPVSHAMEKELIRREIDIMNQLHHPKLINLHDAFEDDDEMVLIYELYVSINFCWLSLSPPRILISAT